MVDVNDLKYVMSLSNRLERFKITNTNPYKINFRCPICGDSKISKRKARGWLIEGKASGLFYYCHNCDANMPLGIFLKNIDPLLYSDYISEKYVNKVRESDTQPTLQIDTPKPVFKIDALQDIKKISQLKYDHPAKQYIENRKIPPNQHFRIYYAPKFKKWINSLIPNKFPDLTHDEPRIVLPFLDKKGKLLGLTGRGFDPNGLRYITIMLNEDSPKIFGLDQVDFSMPYYILEGAFDSFFIPNSVAMAGADGSYKGMDNIQNSITVFDNEPRNKEIHKRMEKVINMGQKICIWPDNIHQKDINEMHLSGITNIKQIIDDNTYRGLEARLRLSMWRKAE